MVVLLACFACLLWGSAYPAIKIGYEMFSIMQNDIASKILFAGYRFVFAGSILLIMAFFTNRTKVFSLSGRDIGEISLLGFLQTAVQYSFFYIGLAHTTGVKGSILNATGTFFSVLLAHFIYKNDKLNIKKSLGCLIGFIGVMIVNFSKGSLDFHFTLLGEGFVIIAALLLSAASIYGKKNLAKNGCADPDRLSIVDWWPHTVTRWIHKWRRPRWIYPSIHFAACLSDSAFINFLCLVDNIVKVQSRRHDHCF